jgi:hypothetical protein
MSPLAPFRKWILRVGIAVALVVTLPLVGLRGVAHADLGDEPSSKSSSGDMNQVEDNDKPKDLLEKKPADAAVEQQKKQQVESTPFYEKWQFWAIAGGVIVGAIALIWGGQALAHQINGGDVRPCNMDFMGRCFGEGR